MPLVLALVVLLSLALTFFDYWIKQSVSDARNVNPLLRWAVGNFGATIGPALLFLILSLPVGVLGWWLIGRIGARYEARKFSDTQLIVDAWWGVVVALHLVTLWRYGAAVAMGACIAAFLLYLFCVRVALVALNLGRRKPGPSLLLLRVFGFQRRTERLFDTVAAQWRFEGGVAMIAGGDLALRSIDAGEALAFARGDIASGYVGDAAKLEEGLRELASASDPDGRYRVSEFFCYENTWRATLRALVARSSVVLMDLRGFTKANTGCVFELQQLAAAGRLSNCVFVTDDTSDRALAASALGAQNGHGARLGARAKARSGGDADALGAPDRSRPPLAHCGAGSPVGRGVTRARAEDWAVPSGSAPGPGAAHLRIASGMSNSHKSHGGAATPDTARIAFVARRAASFAPSIVARSVYVRT